MPPYRRRSAWRRLLPFAILGLIAFIVLRKEFAPFDAWVQKTLDHAGWVATEACVAVAITGAPAPDFVRVIRRGESTRTHNGHHVRGVLIGEMGELGHEVRTGVSCYVDDGGQIAQVTRERWVAEPPTAPTSLE